MKDQMVQTEKAEQVGVSETAGSKGPDVYGTPRKTGGFYWLYLVDLLIFVLIVALDQLTKYLAVKHIKGQEAIVLIKNVLEIDYVENRGTAFGLLSDQKILILFVSIVFLLVILLLLARMPRERKFVICHVFFSMVMAGGIGNMIDRIRLSYVVDFISFVLIRFPVFNVADISVVISVFGLFFLFMFVYKEKDLEFLNFKRRKYR